MIRSASRSDLPAIQALLAAANDAPYDLAAVAEEKCFGAGAWGDPVVRIAGDFEGIAVSSGRFLRLLAVARERRRHGIGTLLLRDAEALGVTTIAAEPGNYFTPGVFATDDAATAFLHSHGYAVTAQTDNLETALGTFELPPEVKRATPDDRERVLAFVEREFGRLWKFESSHAFMHEPATFFYIEHDGEVAGFAAHEANNRGLGFFGPTGVAVSLRGRGYGRLLLLASLADLQRLGHDRAIIPWTDAFEFYRKSCGAIPTHHFATFRTA